MGKKAEFLWGEALVSTAFAAGIYSALRLDPEGIVIEVLSEVIAAVAGPETASNYLLMADLVTSLFFLVVIAGVFAIGRGIGLAAFATMWFSGFLFGHGLGIGVLFLFFGWGLAALAIFVHTNESFQSSQRGYRRF